MYIIAGIALLTNMNLLLIFSCLQQTLLLRVTPATWCPHDVKSIGNTDNDGSYKCLRYHTINNRNFPTMLSTHQDSENQTSTSYKKRMIKMIILTDNRHFHFHIQSGRFIANAAYFNIKRHKITAHTMHIVLTKNSSTPS